MDKYSWRILIFIENWQYSFEKSLETQRSIIILVESYRIPDSNLAQYRTEWIFNPLMGHSMLSDFATKQGHMRIGSKLIPVWCWITPVSIESIRIGFENWFKIYTNEWIHPASRRLWFYPVSDSQVITLHCVSRDFSKTLCQLSMRNQSI